MAKPTKTTDTTESLPTFAFPSATIGAGAYEANIAEVTPAGRLYLLNYGLAKSLSDAVAGLRKKAEADGKTEDEIVATLEAAMKARFDKILTGTIGTGRTGPRAKGLDKIALDVATEWLTAAAAAKGKKLPEKAVDRNPLVAQYLSGKRHDEIMAEAAKRMAAQTGPDDDDADDILSGL